MQSIVIVRGSEPMQMFNELHFSDAVYGFGPGPFFVGHLVFEIPSSLPLHRVGARRWIARIMMTLAVLSHVIAYVANLRCLALLVRRSVMRGSG